VENQGGGKVASGSSAVLSEPSKVIAGTNDGWGHEDDAHEWEPPLDVLVHNLEEGSAEHVDGEGNRDDSDGEHSTSDGEATAAGHVLGLSVRTVAEAAATWFVSGLSGPRSEGPVGLGVLVTAKPAHGVSFTSHIAHSSSGTALFLFVVF